MLSGRKTDWHSRAQCLLHAFDSEDLHEQSGQLGALSEQKQAALRASASSHPGAGQVDARETTGFMPLGVEGRVVAWPKL